MAEKKRTYECLECGYRYPQWVGKCTQCHQWDSIKAVDQFQDDQTVQFDEDSALQTILTLDQVNTEQEENRIITGAEEFDNVLGGGIVVNSVGLLGGEPGVGKSTLILQLLARIAKNALYKTLYVSGEESEKQVKDRANRLLIDQKSIYIIVETVLEKIVALIRKQGFKFIVIDSIQTLYSHTLSSHTGSTLQIKECAMQLMHEAKKNDTTIIIIGHVTKEGVIAGPKVLEHIVDYVFYLEGEKSETLRLLRAVKNRFGPINELGMFKMTAKGLAELKNPNAYFQERFGKNAPGKITSIATEGSRHILVDTQALVGHNSQSGFTRAAHGIERNKLLMLIAIIEKHLNINLFGLDIYLNLADGYKANDATIDMPAIAAILTSHLNSSISNRVIFFGEVSLTGEFKQTPNWQERVLEAQRCQYELVVLPKTTKQKTEIESKNIAVREIANINQLLSLIEEIQIK